MTINYSTAVKNSRLTEVMNAIDAGAGDGVLVIGTSSLSGATGVLATIPLAKPSATIAGGVLTLAGVPVSATAVATGTAAKAELRDSTGTVIASGLTVGVTGADVLVGSTSISSGQIVQVTSGTITHA